MSLYMTEAELLAELKLAVWLGVVLVQVLQEGVQLQGRREWMRKIGVDHNMLPVVATPIATIPSPAPPTPPRHVLPLPILPEAELFPHLFATPLCTTADHHPHQYQVIYELGEKIWTPQDQYIECNFLINIPKHDELDQYHPYFVTPFCTLCYHFIQVAANGPLPNVFLCAKLGQHPPSLHFPFGYIESSFINSIKFLFEQFPPAWLEYFEGALVPLCYDPRTYRAPIFIFPHALFPY